MATKFSLEHSFPTISVALFEKHLNHPQLNEKLAGMPAFRSRSLEERKELPNGEIVWRFKVVAGGNLPPTIQKILSEEMFAWWEESHFYPVEHCIRWSISPLFKQVAFTGNGIWRLEKENKGTRRVIEGEICVKVPFVGKLVENYLINELKRNYEVEPELQTSFYEKMKKVKAPPKDAEQQEV